MTPAQSDFLQRNQLPDSYLEQAQKNYKSVLENFAQAHHKGHSQTRIIAINGSQGSGKSTLADYLCTVIAEQQNIATLALSLDDFYLTKAERLQLSEEVHPLLATRGVPGTHDICLAIATINSLIAAQSPTLVTRFDKSCDDRFPAHQCETVNGPVGLIVLEGWCMGATAQQTSELCDPVNQLEDTEDANAIWRNYVNMALAGDYQRLFSMADTLCMLRAPSFDTIFKWRLEQENKMANPLMNETEILRFIQYYQRITEHCLQEMPSRVDHLFQLDHNRQVTETQ
jgi:D-glycerate 3-kinase